MGERVRDVGKRLLYDYMRHRYGGEGEVVRGARPLAQSHVGQRRIALRLLYRW